MVIFEISYVLWEKQWKWLVWYVAQEQALERTNPEVYDALFDALRPYEQEYTLKKKRKGGDQLRNHISCNLFI